MTRIGISVRLTEGRSRNASASNHCTQRKSVDLHSSGTPLLNKTRRRKSSSIWAFNTDGPMQLTGCPCRRLPGSLPCGRKRSGSSMNTPLASIVRSFPLVIFTPKSLYKPWFPKEIRGFVNLFRLCKNTHRFCPPRRLSSRSPHDHSYRPTIHD